MQRRPSETNVADMIICDNLVKIYKVSTLEVVALQGLDLRVAAGEMVGIIGKSGSGKSTLLSILSGNDRPSAGTVRVAEHNLLALSPRTLAHYRRHVVGVVWQQTARNLLPSLSAQQNVEQPLFYAGTTGKPARRRATDLLHLVGLGDRLRHKPADLSGGEQQRVAIALALANNPRVLLADEPTGELDTATAQEILGVLKRARDHLGVTIVVVTHDALVADAADRAVVIRDGRTSSERVRMEAEAAPDDAARHQEYVVVDRAGRIQIPQDYLRALGIADRAILHLDDGRIVIEALPPPQAEAPDRADTGHRPGQGRGRSDR